MSCADYRLGGKVGLLNHPLLSDENFLSRELETKILPHDHDAVREGQDLLKVVKTLRVLNLGNDPYLIAIRGTVEQLSDRFNIFRASDEGNCHHLEPTSHGELNNVELILV